MQAAVEEALAAVHELIGADEFAEELKRAKSEFWKRVGAPLPGEPLEELRLASFVEWMMFDRRLEGLGRTPAEEYLQRHPELSGDRAEAQLGLTRTLHSIFIIKKRTPAGAWLLDLFSGFKYNEVKRVPITLSKGDLAELRLIPAGGDWFATDALCFHPYSARKQIKKLMKLARKDGTPLKELILDLLARNTKYERAPKTVKGKIYALP